MSLVLLYRARNYISSCPSYCYLLTYTELGTTSPHVPRTVIPEIQKKGDWKRPPTPYVKGLTSGEALRVIIALANNYMEKFCIPGF